MARRSTRHEIAERWRDALSTLHVYKRRGERAVHKPLLTLLLLRQAGVGEPRVVTYREVEKPLASLHREFGPPRAHVHPEFPFWHLQTDGFWVVRDADALPPKRGGSSPSVTVLREQKAAGEVPQDLWDVISTVCPLRFRDSLPRRNGC